MRAQQARTRRACEEARRSELCAFYPFRREVLETVNFQINSDGFIFDQEIVAQVVASGFRIDEIAVPTRYFPEASSASFTASTVYGVKILSLVGRYMLHTHGVASRRFDSLRARYTRLVPGAPRVSAAGPRVAGSSLSRDVTAPAA